jgi:hypothetical protein
MELFFIYIEKEKLHCKEKKGAIGMINIYLVSSPKFTFSFFILMNNNAR